MRGIYICTLILATQIKLPVSQARLLHFILPACLHLTLASNGRKGGGHIRGIDVVQYIIVKL